MTSTSLYDTFGNEIKTQITQDTLTFYLDNATVKFALPEASASLLAEFVPTENINPVELSAIESRLESIGFQKANARAMASILIKVSQTQGVSPFEYFNNNEATLKLAVDTYSAINALRPAGNKIGIAAPIINRKSRTSKMIQP